jgi:hypothetical protein
VQPSIENQDKQTQPQQVVIGQVPTQTGFAQPVMGNPYAGQPHAGQVNPQVFPVGGQQVFTTGFPQTSATVALVLSIVSIFFGGICLAIPALIVANEALKVTNQYPGHPDASNANIARIISLIIIGLTVLVIAGFGLLMIIGMAAA